MRGLQQLLQRLFFTSDVDEPKPVTEDPRIARARWTVLAIDDEVDFLTGLRGILQDAGFNVLTSTSGPKGLDMLRYARDVGVVVLDYNMPNFNGSETLAYVRRLSPHAKVVALTGMESNRIPSNFRSGVDRVMHKPCSSAELIASIDTLLDHGRAAERFGSAEKISETR